MTMKKWLSALICALALLSPTDGKAVTTTKFALSSTAWTDLGVGPIIVSPNGSIVYAIADTTPAIPLNEGLKVLSGGSTVINTASHVWAMNQGASGASVYVAPILASSGGGGAAGAITPDGSGLVVQKNGTQPQTFRVYESYTDASNGDWGTFDWTSNPGALTIGVQANGAVSAYKVIRLTSNGLNFVTLNGNNDVMFMQHGLAGYGTAAISTGGLVMGLNGVIGFSSGYPSAGPDIAFSRLSGGVLALGNGAYGDVSGLFVASAYRAAGTQPTITGAGGTCATTTKVGGATAGTVVLSAVCATTNTIAFTGMPAQTNGYVCDAVDRTTRTAGPFIESATTTTGFTLTVGATSSVAADVLQWKCMGY
jgi:hypothetical protein